MKSDEEIINKKRSKSFCMCFDPADMGKGWGIGPTAVERPTSTEGVKPVLPPQPPNMCLDDVDNEADRVVVDDGSFGRGKKLGRRSFSRYVKAVLFEASLMKIMKTKKIGRKLSRTYNSVKSKPKKIAKSISSMSLRSNDHHHNHDQDDDQDPSITNSTHSSSCNLFTTSAATNSTLSSATTSRCSSSSSLSLSERPEIMKNNMTSTMQLQAAKGIGKGNGNNKGSYCFAIGGNVGICLLLVSLFVLVMWGKLCAIFCTSTWLFLGLHWSNVDKLSSNSPPNCSVNPNFIENYNNNTDAEKYYKKKIIMEGLLERKHNRIVDYLNETKKS